MKMSEAEAIMNAVPGYVVEFEWRENGMLRSDRFPDVQNGETPIKSEEIAWELASKFADKLGVHKIANVYVAHANSFEPVDGYMKRGIFMQ